MNNTEVLIQKRKKIAEGGGQVAVDKQHSKGKLTARERINKLFDENTFCEIDAYVCHRCTQFSMEEKIYPGDGVIGGYGKINGRLAFAYAQDFTVLGGTMGEEQANKICRLIEMAMQSNAPIIGMNDSGGARIQEGVNSLSGYGKIFYMNTKASGVIPQITAIMGPCAGGAVYSPALTDFVFVVDKISQMFITGPNVIKSVTGENVDAETLGGAETHSMRTGNAHFFEPNEETCIKEIRELLSYLPSSYQKPVPLMAVSDKSLDKPALETIIPENPSKSYDMHQIIGEIADHGDYFEYMKGFAPNILTVFARINGRSVGIIANQPKVQAGCLDVNASDKAARFIRTCDAFGVALITLMDVPGFLPGLQQELSGIIRHGAKMLYAYSEATVPKVTVILRKAYGGAYLAMCSKNLGSDMVFAWPSAEIAVMGEEGAANILIRHEQNAEAREEWKRNYKETFMNPYVAAERGQVNDVIFPRETRIKLATCLEMLASKPQNGVKKKHGNIPL